jgi:hypothetical protein
VAISEPSDPFRPECVAASESGDLSLFLAASKSVSRTQRTALIDTASGRSAFEMTQPLYETFVHHGPQHAPRQRNIDRCGIQNTRRFRVFELYFWFWPCAAHWAAQGVDRSIPRQRLS